MNPSFVMPGDVAAAVSAAAAGSDVYGGGVSSAGVDASAARADAADTFDSAEPDGDTHAEIEAAMVRSLKTRAPKPVDVDGVAARADRDAALAWPPFGQRGKISRLPKEVREGLNQRIRDGVCLVTLLNWLNGLEVVKLTLQGMHTRTRITVKNLEGWKQGGYLDWVAHEERRDWLERLTEESEDLLDDAGHLPVIERVGTQVEVLLGRAVDQVAKREVDLENEEELGRLLTLSREVGRHRRLAMVAGLVRERRMGEEAVCDG